MLAARNASLTWHVRTVLLGSGTVFWYEGLTSCWHHARMSLAEKFRIAAAWNPIHSLLALQCRMFAQARA